MSAVKDSLQVADVELKVKGRGLNLVVTQELLDIADVDSPLEKVRGTSMPESMRMHTGDAGSKAHVANPGLELAPADALSLSAEKKCRLLGIVKQARPRLASVGERRIKRLPRDGKAPVFFSFSVPDEKLTVFEVHVGDVEPNAFT